MRRSFFLLTLIVIIVMAFAMHAQYKSIVYHHKQSYKSNVSYPDSALILSGTITDLNLTNNTFVLKLEPSRKVLIKVNEPEVLSSINDATAYDVSIKVNANQRQYILPKNASTFDYDKHLFSKGISEQYFMQTLLDSNPSDTFNLSHIRLIHRKWITETIDTYFSVAQRGLLYALLLGDRTSYDSYDQIKALGLAHLFAISGLHFGVIYKALQNVCFIRSRLLRLLFVIFFMGYLILIVGGAYSALRAFFMILYTEACHLFRRKPDVFTNMAISLMLILWIEPFAILNTGLHLSYYAYFCVAVVYRRLFKNPFKSRLMEGLRFCLVLQLLLIPGTLYYYHDVNLYSFFANMVAVPIIGFILPGTLLFLLVSMLDIKLLSVLFAALLSHVISLFEGISALLPIKLSQLEWVRETDYAILLGWVLFFALSLVFWKLGLLSKSIKRALLAGLIIVASASSFISSPDLKVTFFDVSHGDMALIEFDGYALLIDTGEGKLDPSALLKGRGIHRIDAVILSHAHQDHVGGLEALIDNHDVSMLYVNRSTKAKLLEMDSSDNMIFNEVSRPTTITFGDDLSIDLIPVLGRSGANDPNDDALVVKMNYRNHVGYFMGDISHNVVDHLLLAHHDTRKHITFIKTPHHGSKTSLSTMLYESYTPSYALISHGTRYKMPNQDVIRALEANDIVHYSTYEYGEINLLFRKSFLKIVTYLREFSLLKLILLVL